MSKFKFSALITASGGIGSHFVLHKIHGHPSIAALKELSFRSQGGTTKGDLKKMLSRGLVPKKIVKEQLLPAKDINNCEWLVLNKPPLKMINYHRTFHPDISILYIFRNPVSFYYTWIKKWKEYGERRYGKTVSDDIVFEWFKTTFMSSLFELAQTFRPETDHIISFEHFFNDIDSELGRIFRCLDIPVVKNKDLKILNKCSTCGTEKVIRKKVHVRGERFEEVLYCHRHGPCLGPGEYNYIRKEDASFLNKWKAKPDHVEMCKRFSSLFGDDLIKYYLEEGYLKDVDRKAFDRLIQEFLERLKSE